MNERLKELYDKRKKSVEEMRGIVEKAAEEKREMTKEENERHSKLFDDQASIKEQIQCEERQVELDRELANNEIRALDAEKAQAKGKELSKEDRQMIGFQKYLRTGKMNDADCAEFRDLQADSDTEGGYLVAPQQFASELIKSIDDLVHIRRLATVIPVTNGDSLGALSLDADPEDGDWTGEITSVDEDTQMAFGKRELNPTLVSKLIKVSRKLLRTSALPVDQLVRNRLAYKFSITHEKAFLTGTGANQPLGLFTASANGVSTGRDVSTGNTTKVIAADNLKEIKYSLKGAYRRNAQWLFHRDAIKQVSKLKDGTGRYLWQDAIREGEPDMLLGRPVNESEYAPNTFTTGLYVGLFGDFSYYWIADALNMEIQTLFERYAETNQVGMIGRMETDGMPVLEEAFARVTLA